MIDGYACTVISSIFFLAGWFAMVTGGLIERHSGHDANIAIINCE